MFVTNEFMGHSIEWWMKIYRVLDLFEVKDADHLAFILRVRERQLLKETSDGK